MFVMSSAADVSFKNSAKLSQQKTFFFEFSPFARDCNNFSPDDTHYILMV
jgi:hypothetical protein